VCVCVCMCVYVCVRERESACVRAWGRARLEYVKMKPRNVIPFKKDEVGRYVAMHGRHTK